MRTPALALQEPLATVVQLSPLLSVVVSVLAVLVALASRRTAMSSYELAKQAQLSAKPNLSIHLVDATARPIQESGASTGYTLRIHVQVTNLSTESIWLRRAALWIEYPTQEGLTRSEVSLPSGPEPASTLTFPVELKAQQVVEGLLAFDITRARTNGALVDRHTLSLTDTHGQQWHYEDIRAGARYD